MKKLLIVALGIAFMTACAPAQHGQTPPPVPPGAQPPPPPPPAPPHP